MLYAVVSRILLQLRQKGPGTGGGGSSANICRWAEEIGELEAVRSQSMGCESAGEIGELEPERSHSTGCESTEAIGELDPREAILRTANQLERLVG